MEDEKVEREGRGGDRKKRKKIKVRQKKFGTKSLGTKKNSKKT